MLKRWLCCLLATMLLFSALPVQARAEDVYVYDPVTFLLRSSMDATQKLEAEFREMVRAASLLYMEKYYDPAAGPAKYYYNASKAKADFDAKNGLLVYTNADLAFNTNAQVSERDYEKETRSVITYMLAKDIQNKVEEMEYLTAEEKKAIFPGKMFDATTGAWEINEQAMWAQQMEENDVAEKIALGTTEAGVLFARTIADYIMYIAGASQKDAYDLTNTITDVIKEVWGKVIELEYEQRRIALKNAYREAMIEDVMAAQQNVDDRIYQGLYEVRDTLKRIKNKSQEDELMLEGVEDILSAVEKAKTQEQVISGQYEGKRGTTTIKQTIEQIAEDLVDEAGMTEEEYLSQQQMMTETLAVTLKEVVKIAVKKALGDEHPLIDTALTEALDKELEGLMLASEKENWDTNHDNKLGMDEILVAVGKHVSVKEIETIIKKYVEQSAVLKGYDKTKIRYETKAKELQEQQELYEKYNRNRKTKQHRKAERQENNARIEWEEMQQNQNFLNALVETAVDNAKSFLELVKATDDLLNSGRDETTVSFIASTMYRTRQLADKARMTVQLDYRQYFADSVIDTAPIEELQDFLDSMYTVISTDLLGQSYYTTLVAWYDAQNDPEEFERNKALAEQLYEQKRAKAEEMGGLVDAGWTMLGWLYKGIYVCAAGIESMNSLYLESHTWTSFTTSVDRYNEIGEDLGSFVPDDDYAPLFE